MPQGADIEWEGEEKDEFFEKIDKAKNRRARKEACLKADVPWKEYQEWVSRTKRTKNKSRRTQWTELRRFKEEREGLIEI